MESIKKNPFRIVGILANTTDREFQRQRAKLNAYMKVGKELHSDLDFSFLQSITRTNDAVVKAFSDIEQNQDKVKHALFWFLNASTFDNTAIEYLKNGDEEKAIEIWAKVTDNKNLNARNYSALNNLGTYKLLSNSISTVQEGIRIKLKLIASDYFENFVHAVADETFIIDQNKQSQEFIETLLNEFKGAYSNSQILNFFNTSSRNTVVYIKSKLTEEPIHKIELEVGASKRIRKENALNAYQYGLDLYNKTKSNLNQLQELLNKEDLKYKSVADHLANEIMQCGIDYFNECQKNNSSGNFLESAQKLNKLASSIAVGKLTKDRAKDNHASLEDMKDREINEALAVLQSVKDAYETNEANIRRQIEELKQNDIELKYGLKTINYSAVEDNIRNSINWSKVNELLKNVLTDKNLQRIKECNKTEAKNEFWELINWLEDHSLMSLTISNIIDTYKKILPKLFFNITSADITNTDSKSNAITEPFYIENIRYVGLKLNINSTGIQSVNIYKKYINPEGKYKHSSNSPEGYTTSDSKTITPQTTNIDLGGYGNGKECTYQVGEHKIEVYVEHFKVYTKTFKVDWSPNKKAELKRKLDILQNELKEVQKFKWFRGAETKQKEVKVVQDKIKKTKNILMNK